MEVLSGVSLQIGLSMYILEGLKKLVYKYKPDIEIDPRWYDVALPVLNSLVALLFAVLAFSGYTLPTNWIGWLQALGQQFILALVTAFIYDNTLKKQKVNLQMFKERLEMMKAWKTFAEDQESVKKEVGSK